MTTLGKAIWNNKIVTILDIEHKSSFGNLLRVKIDYTGEIKIVNSQYLKKYKH